jgi:hypothetical protein
MSHHNHGKIRLVGSSEGVDGDLTPPDPVGRPGSSKAATDAGTAVSVMLSQHDKSSIASDTSFAGLPDRGILAKKTHA